MNEKLIKLYNTLMTIDTRGANTLTMADCLCFLKNIIEEEQNGHCDAVEPKDDTKS